MQIRTFVIRSYDSACYEPLLAAIPQICCGKCLVVLEKEATNPHAHVVFETELSKEAIDTIIADISVAHPRKKRTPNARPVAQNKDPVTDGFWQYVSKEKFPVILYKVGFTDEELVELHDKSDALRLTLKSTLSNYIRDNARGGNPDELLLSAALCAIEHYSSTDTMAPPNIASLVRHACLKHFPSDELKLCLAKRIVSRI